MGVVAKGYLGDVIISAVIASAIIDSWVNCTSVCVVISVDWNAVLIKTHAKAINGTNAKYEILFQYFTSIYPP